MAGSSSANTPATPESLRASDSERDHAVAELRNEFAHGRLSQETFLIRMQTALGAQNRGQLASLFTDLPPRRTGLSERIRAAWRGLRRHPQDPQNPQNPQNPQVGGETAAVVGYLGLPGRPHALGQHRPGEVPPPYWPQQQAPSPPSPPSFRPPTPLHFPPGAGTRFTIGRTQDCDLRLTDLSVSRSHAELTREEDGWLLNDLGSHNGTRVNGWLIREPVPVRAGDRVEFGSAVFIMRDGSAIES
jgi:hypothetical protein